VPSEPSRILILGGTGEARLLAERLDADPRFAPVTSLAGVTGAPEEIAGERRSGGFGGVMGLKHFIEDDGIGLVIDATHPFATRISANAVEACSRAGVTCLRLERQAWTPRPGDDWTVVPDTGAAALAIAKGARALVTVGRQEIEPFFARAGVLVIARMIEPPDVNVPAHAEIILARPPFSLDEERALMREKSITVLVAKNSGGDATYPKIEAARELGLPAIMIARPAKAEAKTFANVEEVLCGIEEKLG
jgi:precorrin-6A/cobalt-precorrin-6A reductase